MLKISRVNELKKVFLLSCFFVSILTNHVLGQNLQDVWFQKGWEACKALKCGGGPGTSGMGTAGDVKFKSGTNLGPIVIWQPATQGGNTHGGYTMNSDWLKILSPADQGQIPDNYLVLPTEEGAYIAGSIVGNYFSPLSVGKDGIPLYPAKSDVPNWASMPAFMEKLKKDGLVTKDGLVMVPVEQNAE